MHALDLKNIDLDELEGLSDEDLYAHFLDMARKSKPGPICEVIGIHHGTSHSKNELDHLYATSRQATCVKLRMLLG